MFSQLSNSKVIMNPNHQPTLAYELDDPQDVLLTLARCAECTNPACVTGCPEHVDLRAALRAMLQRVPGLARQEELSEGIMYAEHAIEECYN